VDLQADSQVLTEVPTVAHTQTMANSALQVSYSHEELRTVAPATEIEKQWIYMQACVQQLSAAPLVLVVDGPVSPFTLQDDVVRNENPQALVISSVPIASASLLHGPVIQISVADFDGSLGTPLFNLRSIMGRHLWLSAGLAERDYPFQCAQSEPV